MTRILVTGSTGQVGRTLLDAARAAGHEVHGLARSDRAPCDLTDPAAVELRLRAVGPEVIIHAGALTDVDRCEREPELAHRINVASTEQLARWADRTGSHLVYVSTNYVFDGSQPEPYRCDAPTSPISVYGRTKAAGEVAAGPSAAVARTAWVTSRDGPSLVHAVLRRGLAGEAMHFLDDQHGQATVAEDLAPALLHLVDRRLTGTWHLTNPEHHTPASLARLVLEVSGLDPDLIRTAGPDDPERRRPAQRPTNGLLDLESTRAAHPALALPAYAASLRALVATIPPSGTTRE